MSKKLSKGELGSLVAELNAIERWLDPAPDPAQWPPAGWQYHPTQPGTLYRVVSEEELREEIFGSERKTQWTKKAKERAQEIKDILSPYFFPNPKDEGIQRVSKSGFVAMLKTGLKREVDEVALPSILAECKKSGCDVEGEVITWVPKFALKRFRELPPKIKDIFEQALIVTPENPVLEIAVQESQDD